MKRPCWWNEPRSDAAARSELYHEEAVNHQVTRERDGHEKGGGDCSPPPSFISDLPPVGLLEAVVRKADQAPSEAGSTLKPGPMVDDRLIFFT